MMLAAAHLAHYATSTWFEPLGHLMLPCERLPLGPADCDAILEHARGMRRPAAFSRTLHDDLAQVLADAQGAHLRLEGCSLRGAARVPCVMDARDAIAALSLSNARVVACQALVGPHLDEQHLYLFAWVDMAPAREFRIIVQDRRLLGITPYHGERGYDAALHPHLAAIEAVLSDFARELAALAPRPDFAADVFLDSTHAPWLIELNPLGPTTATGLFQGDFDGRLRYPGPPQAITAPDDIWRI